MAKIYMLCGVPSSGKTWIANQLKDKFDYIPHDNFIDKNGAKYLDTILRKAQSATQALLIETPFSISILKEPIERQKHDLECVFVIESEGTLKARYYDREGRPLPKNHASRQKTYKERAEEYGSFKGTSDEVLAYLRTKNG